MFFITACTLYACVSLNLKEKKILKRTKKNPDALTNMNLVKWLSLVNLW